LDDVCAHEMQVPNVMLNTKVLQEWTSGGSQRVEGGRVESRGLRLARLRAPLRERWLRERASGGEENTKS